jgi:hypothetical protein
MVPRLRPDDGRKRHKRRLQRSSSEARFRFAAPADTISPLWSNFAQGVEDG